MSQSNLIAPVILREAVQIPPSHARAQIAGRLLDIVHRVKNLRLKELDRNPQKSCVILDNASVFRAVSRIHADKK